MFATPHHRQQLDKMFLVQAPEEIEYLVKESEIVTGQPGRTFVIASADRLIYRIQWHPIGYQVQRLNAAGNTICTLNMAPRSSIARLGRSDADRAIVRLFIRNQQAEEHELSRQCALALLAHDRFVF